MPVVRSEHRGVVALTAMHPGRCDRRLGGVRFVRDGSVAEVVHLAEGMHDKCAASGVPVDGQKTLVICADDVPASPSIRAELLSEHMRVVIAQDARGIFGPDMACGADVLDLVAADPELAGCVTGLSAERGGIDINGRALTALGLAHALEYFTDATGTRVGTATVQGFGMVGAPLAATLATRGITVRAVSNARGALVTMEGLDVAALVRLWRESGDDCLARYVREVGGAALRHDPGQLFAVPADLFVPAARTMALAMDAERDIARAENPDVESVERFHEAAHCRVVLEGANHPLSHAAERYLESRGVVILPDVLVNIGGMVGCHEEWRARQSPPGQRPDPDELAQRCREFTNRVVAANIRQLISARDGCRAAAARIIESNRATVHGASA